MGRGLLIGMCHLRYGSTHWLHASVTSSISKRFTSCSDSVNIFTDLDATI